MNDTTLPKPRFGAVTMQGPTAQLIAGVLPTAADHRAEEPSTPSTPSRKAARPRTSRASAADSAATYIYPGVREEIRLAAIDLAKQLHRTIADLVILGTELPLSYGIEQEPGAPTGLPLSKPRSAQTGLNTWQVRVTGGQKAWLEDKAARCNAVSLRQYTGAALTAYVQAHSNGGQQQ